MKNLLTLFVFVAVMAIVMPVLFVGHFQPRWADAANLIRNNDAALFAPAEFPDPDTGATSTDSSFLKNPPLGYLERIAGDPSVKPGETAVRVPVLMYHHIRPMRPNFSKADREYTVTPEAFEEQMHSLWLAGYETITPDDLLSAIGKGQSSLPTKSVLITFDDGFRDQYQYAFPVLKKYHLKATFFIVSQAHSLAG
ncbi:MAG TPA: polysaccharide deacetylase family protein, partial [Patescibacteria group bacterium]|nr:polysaccharide deacetylase family protein [Patescibacteria group bacterium]